MQANIRPQVRGHSTETLNEFFIRTHDKSAVFLVTPTVVKSPLLQMQNDMVSIPIDDSRARITSYLVLRDDYQKKSINIFLEAMEKTIEKDIVQDENNNYPPHISLEEG